MSAADWYHASLKPISRSTGRSAVACAAYRTGTAIEDERYGSLRDFTRKGDVVAHFTLAPEGALAWASDPAQLWNQVEKCERRKDSQLAFDWEVALPNELSDAQREHIARRFSAWLVSEYGVAVTTGIHHGHERGNGMNDHCHVMMTQRAVGENGFEAKKLPHFSTRPGKANPEVARVREQVATFINEELEEAGSDSRVSHLSLAARGITREPTTHLGPAAAARERRDAGSDRGDVNRAIIEERLRWQQEQVAPAITAELERELAARWGDDWQPLAPTETAEQQDLAPGTPADTSEPHSGWRRFADRARAFQARLREVWDEASGSADAAHSFAGRVLHAGRKLWQGWHDRSIFELKDGAGEVVDLVRDKAVRAPSDKPPDPVATSWPERLAQTGRSIVNDERGGVPMTSAFDRYAEQWTHGAAPELPEPTTGPELPDIEPDTPDIT